MLFIGIDLGTSAVKLLLMNENGEILKTVSREYPLFFPHPGWSEQNPDTWLESTLSGLCELLENADKGDICGISFGGQMHGMVALDQNDRVVRPAILWNDGRTEKQTKYLNEVIGKKRLTELTGNIAFAGFTAPKILWMKENEPENFSRVKKIMLPKDFLAYRLSGSFCTDVSDASGTLLFDVENRRFSEEMLQICGIKRDVLPKVYESYEIVGTLKKEYANALGLPENVKIAAGAGDNAAAAIGTGTVENGDCNISLGTSGTVFISKDTFALDGANALHSFAHANGKYHLMGCMLSAASCNKWWCENILKTSDFSAEQQKAPLPKDNPVIFLPYLMGERSPHNNPDARGVFFGMSMDTRREDMTVAVLEGVAFALRDSIEAAKAAGAVLRSTKICGGGAKSPLWRSIIANVTGLTVERVESEQGPALGAAMLAAVGCGCFSSVDSAAKAVVRVTDKTLPDAEILSQYEKKYNKFRQLYPALKELF